MRDGMRKTERGQTHAGVSLRRLRDTGDGDEERDEGDGARPDARRRCLATEAEGHGRWG